MVLWGRQFPPKNEQKKVNLRYHTSKVEFIHSFLEEIDDPTNHFEINWPLVRDKTWRLFWSIGSFWHPQGQPLGGQRSSLECILYLLLPCNFSFRFFFFIFLFSHQIIAKQLLSTWLHISECHIVLNSWPSHIYKSTISPTSNSTIDFQVYNNHLNWFFPLSFSFFKSFSQHFDVILQYSAMFT